LTNLESCDVLDDSYFSKLQRPGVLTTAVFFDTDIIQPRLSNFMVLMGLDEARVRWKIKKWLALG